MFPGQLNNNLVNSSGFPNTNNNASQGQQMVVAGTAGPQQEGLQMEQKAMVVSEQQQQDPGMLPPSQNPFYKTRICKLWRLGNCHNGDSCSYAHGEFEVRYPDMELLKQQSNTDMVVGGGRGMLPPQPNNALMQQPPPYMQHKQQMQQIAPGGYGGFNPPPPHFDGQIFRDMMYKTKMCPSFVQRGWCNYEDKCSFAHSRQELRPFPPMADEMYFGMHRGDLGLPQYRERGHFTGQMRPDMKFPGNFEEPFVPKQVTYLEKVRGLCGVIGLGNATDYTNKNPYVAAMAAEGIENGDMLKGNPYADDVKNYVNIQ